MCSCLGMTALLLTGFVLVGHGAGTVGATTTAMLVFLALFGPIAQLLFVIDDLQSAAASLARIVRGDPLRGTRRSRPASTTEPASQRWPR